MDRVTKIAGDIRDENRQKNSSTLTLKADEEMDCKGRTCLAVEVGRIASILTGLQLT